MEQTKPTDRIDPVKEDASRVGKREKDGVSLLFKLNRVFDTVSGPDSKGFSDFLLDPSSKEYKSRSKTVFWTEFKGYYKEWCNVYDSVSQGKKEEIKKRLTKQQYKKWLFKRYRKWVTNVCALLNVHLFLNTDKLSAHLQEKCKKLETSYAGFYKKISQNNSQIESLSKKKADTFVSFEKNTQQINEKIEESIEQSKTYEPHQPIDEKVVVPEEEEDAAAAAVLNDPDQPGDLPVLLVKKCLNGTISFLNEPFYPSLLKVYVLRTTFFQRHRDQIFFNNIGVISNLVTVKGVLKEGATMMQLLETINMTDRLNNDCKNEQFRGRHFSDGQFHYWIMFKMSTSPKQFTRLKKHYDVYKKCAESVAELNVSEAFFPRSFVYSTEYSMYVAKMLANAQSLATQLLKNELKWTTTHCNAKLLQEVANLGDAAFTTTLTTIKYKHHRVKKIWKMTKQKDVREARFLESRIKNVSFDGGLVLFSDVLNQQKRSIAVAEGVSQAKNTQVQMVNNAALEDRRVADAFYEKEAESVQTKTPAYENAEESVNNQKSSSSSSSSLSDSDIFSSSSSEEDEEPEKTTMVATDDADASKVDAQSRSTTTTTTVVDEKSLVEPCQVTKQQETIVDALIQQKDEDAVCSPSLVRLETTTINETTFECKNPDSNGVLQTGVFSLKTAASGDPKSLFRVANTDIVYTSSLKSKTQTKFNAALKDVPNVIWFEEPALRKNLFGSSEETVVYPSNILDPRASRKDAANRLYEESLDVAASEHTFVCWPVKKERKQGKVVVFRDKDMMEQRKDFFL